MELARALHAHPSIKRVSFEYNHFDPEGFHAVTSALGSNSTLEYFSIAQENIGVAGAANIAALMRENTTIKQLDIMVCGLGTGWADISSALVSNRTLKKVRMANNFIGQEGVDALLEAFGAHPTLQTLELKEVDIGVDVIRNRAVE